MKQMQSQQKEAFLLSTLTPVAKKIYHIFNEKVSRNKMQGDIFLTNILNYCSFDSLMPILGSG